MWVVVIYLVCVALIVADLCLIVYMSVNSMVAFIIQVCATIS